MNDGNARQLLLGTWGLAIVIITWAGIRNYQQSKTAQNFIEALPHPSRIVKTSAVYTILGVISEGSPKLAATMGVGLLIPIFLLTQGEGKQLSPAEKAQNQFDQQFQSLQGSVAAAGVVGAIA